MTDYERYLIGLRKSPGAIVLVKLDANNYRTYWRDAMLVGYLCDRPVAELACCYVCDIKYGDIFKLRNRAIQFVGNGDETSRA